MPYPGPRIAALMVEQGRVACGLGLLFFRYSLAFRFVTMLHCVFYDPDRQLPRANTGRVIYRRRPILRAEGVTQ